MPILCIFAFLGCANVETLSFYEEDILCEASYVYAPKTDPDYMNAENPNTNEVSALTGLPIIRVSVADYAEINLDYIIPNPRFTEQEN